MVLVTTWSPDRRSPFRARFSAWVPFRVNTIRAGSATPKSRATASRAAYTVRAASRAKASTGVL